MGILQEDQRYCERLKRTLKEVRSYCKAYMDVFLEVGRMVKKI
jgi:hypothetical protein